MTFFIFFEKKHDICVLSPSKTTQKVIFGVFEGPSHQVHDFFAKKIEKVKNLDPSHYWILIYLAVGENQK